MGICVPVDGMFGVDKKIPSKRLGSDNLSFVLLPKDAPVQEEEIQEEEPQDEDEMFIPVTEEEPFEFLDRLQNAHLAEQEGQTGIVIPVAEEEETECEEEAPQ